MRSNQPVPVRSDFSPSNSFTSSPCSASSLRVIGALFSRACFSISCIYIRMLSPSASRVSLSAAPQKSPIPMPIDGMKVTSCMFPRARVPSKS